MLFLSTIVRDILCETVVHLLLKFSYSDNKAKFVELLCKLSYVLRVHDCNNSDMSLTDNPAFEELLLADDANLKLPQ